MNIKDIAQRAKESGICKEWFSRMQKTDSIETICRMYFEGSDWSMEQDFPTLEMLRDTPETAQYGLHTDAKGKVEAYQLPDGRKQIALFGNSDVVLEFSMYDVAQVIIRHNSKVKINAKDHAYVMVEVLDNGEMIAEQQDMANVVEHLG